MAEPLKNWFDKGVVQSIARELAGGDPRFPVRPFVRACLLGLDDLELTARGWHVAEAMHRYLPQPFAEAARVLRAALGPELERTDTFGMAPFRYLPHVF